MSAYVRAAGTCLIAAGVLIAGAVFHPDIFEISFADAALGSPYWTAWHAAWLSATILSLFGLAGLAARHGALLGALGVTGLLLAVPGLVLTACAAYYEAFLFPPLARADPALLDWDGPLLGSTMIRVIGGLALLWLAGLLLVGIAAWRTRVVPPGAAALLSAGAAGFGAFEGPFVPVLGVISVLVFAAGHIWLGYALRSTNAAAAFPVSRTATAE
jgi:hypothetical protein